MWIHRAHASHRLLRAGALLLILVSGVRPGHTTPLDFLPVGDPLEAELRTLDVLGGYSWLPHLGMRPLQIVELQAAVAPQGPDQGSKVSLIRLGRALARDGVTGFADGPVHGTTPRTLQYAYPDDQRFDVSVGFQGRGDLDRWGSAFTSGTGLHLRAAAGFRGLLVYSHVMAAHVKEGLAFAEPLVAGNDAIIHTEETYLAYSGTSARWGAQFGRSRWHWGPGEEASLVLSKTSVPLTGLAFRASIEPLRADGIALSATLDAASGEQLAAHRLEWRPGEGLRIGLSEAARYRAPSWQPLYLLGLIPYVLVQRLHVQDRPESSSVLRNNVVVAFDAAWRAGPGARLYGEWLIDDVQGANTTRKYGYQVGWEGVAAIGATRLVWGTEYTRLTRYVYTSFFGRDFASQGQPLGFPTGPDARRVRVRAALDLSPSWQLSAAVAQTDKGENDLDEPLLPGTSGVDSEGLEGVVETSRELELGIRFWPASGVDVALFGGYRWIEDAGHAAGVDRESLRGALALRLIR